MVAVDPGLLEGSVANLVENAVKYSASGERVLVSASVMADRVEVRVVDRGPGVPDEAKDRIFEPFQRYGDAPRGAGVGLGLAVARGFAEAMGGTLSPEDTPGGTHDGAHRPGRARTIRWCSSHGFAEPWWLTVEVLDRPFAGIPTSVRHLASRPVGQARAGTVLT